MTAARTPLSGAAPVAPAPFEPSRGYRLNPDVALRPEPFGALAYHFGTRRLSFLKAPGLVDLVRELDRHPSVTDGLAAVPEGTRDPVGDVYACPFAIHDEFRAGSVREPGGFAQVWRSSPLFARLRTESSGGSCESCPAYSSCQGGCMAAKFFTGLPLDGPDPECVRGQAKDARHVRGAEPPRASLDHSRRGRAVALGMPSVRGPAKPCDSSPLAAAR
ncbi:MAG: mycofactocin biosynthesis chaperone MftB [Streptosporangiaceae bacterium]|jgi:putative mycofactocin binding protein MftB